MMVLHPTLIHRLAQQAHHAPHQPALHGYMPERWESWSWSRYHHTTQRLARALRLLGVARGQEVALCARLYPRTLIAQLAIMTRGALPVLIPFSTPEAVTAVIATRKIRVVFSDHVPLIKHLLEQRVAGTLALDTIITRLPLGFDDPAVHVLDDLAEQGRDLDRDQMWRDLDALRAEDPALMWATDTKHAVVWHHNTLNRQGELLATWARLATGPDAVSQRVMAPHGICCASTQLTALSFAINVRAEVFLDTGHHRLSDHLAALHPTTLVASQAAWQRVASALAETRWAALTPLVTHLHTWRRAPDVAGAWLGRVAQGAWRGLDVGVLSRLRRHWGLDALTIAIAGPPPVASATQGFFAGLGVPLAEGFGSLESGGLCIVSPHRAAPDQRYGLPLPGVHVMQRRGELLVKGRGLGELEGEAMERMSGDGWLHTGHRAWLDQSGHVHWFSASLLEST